MTFITDVIKEIGNIRVLQRTGGSADIVSGLTDSVAKKISTILTFDAGSAVTLTQAISDSELPDKFKDVLTKSCNDRTMGYIETSTGDSRRASGAPPRDQTIRDLYNYLTAKDWAVFDSAMSSEDRRNHTMVSRLDRLGVRRASDIGLIKWAVTILVDCEFKLSGTWPSYWAVYHRVTAIKQLMHAIPAYTGPFVDKFPEFPHDLSPDHFKIAYDTNDPPISRPIAQYDNLGQHVPLRSSSKLLARDGPECSGHQGYTATRATPSRRFDEGGHQQYHAYQQYPAHQQYQTYQQDTGLDYNWNAGYGSGWSTGYGSPSDRTRGLGAYWPLRTDWSCEVKRIMNTNKL